MAVKTLLKAAVSLLLLFSIFLMVDFKQFTALLKQIDINYIFIALFLAIFRTAAGILRLFYLLRQLFNTVSLSKVIHDSLIAGFYNLFFPTVIGGDIPKLFLLNRHLDDKKKITSSILLERFLGFFSLIVLALISILTIRLDMKNYNAFLAAIGVVFIIFTVVFVVVSNLSFSHLSNARRSDLASKFVALIETLQIFKINQICMVFIQSLIYQSLGIILVYFLGRSLGMELGIIPYFIALPLIWFAIMIPASISGLGIREGAFIYFFSLFGVNQELGLGLSLMFFIQSLAVGSIGGILLLKDAVFNNPDNKKE